MSHTSAQEQTFAISLIALAEAQVKCRISMQAMQISGYLRTPWIERNSLRTAANSL